MNCPRPADGSRVWQTAEAVHVDVRGLEPPEPMVAILQLIDGGEAGPVLIAHLDREPIFLYPELNERGWTYEMLPSAAGTCQSAVTLKMMRPPA